MRLLITGSSGQLGEVLQNILSEHHEVICTARNKIKKNSINLDITNKIMLKEVLDATEPDLVINLAAMTNVDLCEKDPETAKRINLLGVENICNIFSIFIIIID